MISPMVIKMRTATQQTIAGLIDAGVLYVDEYGMHVSDDEKWRSKDVRKDGSGNNDERV